MCLGSDFIRVRKTSITNAYPGLVMSEHLLGGVMLKAADLRRIQRCREQGFSKGRTAEMLGFSRVTVRKYWSAVDCVVAPRKSAPRSVLAPHRELVYALFRQYRSCPRLAEVLREEHGIEVGLRAVQKFVEPLRETLRREDELYLQKRAERELAAANATIRANEREELRRMRELARSQACLSAAAVQAGDEVSLTREIIGTLPAAVYEEPARRTRRRAQDAPPHAGGVRHAQEPRGRLTTVARRPPCGAA